ncbi:deoxyguanosinetriphosphate triphosphohydrolase [Flavobacterium columnare NBRC 100251 = ATCC 23463]|uniref:Deoxyguanosinetriphosphate triphosphohydrolase (dGTPase) n=2 Tax=Flavobacterium columnare TaxID=996 RepID=G8X5K9_FLACA|nr:deoxyguanosinetriphosphate triphosphohydrolase [Flavobacterium columnare]AEW86853.2 deoxyguanosinetriphosphate triphosphohydrolase (dGTPase) [Flavobacterium columnare ATCC 49512]AMO20768.1 deoxyguanosinetriphosphate triphosphohydrolase [Flavobacterium columnare]ANO47279.1 deoxyguanosinetriphosphate triphosphohydrolase (dGTPase) [Flavobacterium columnare]APT22055.1 deoxyguanosinetriphosphate triphosphohydrolase [Flavobacterium columnare]AUX18753.1 dGTPase [Flavobacterium columnare]
MNWEQLLSLKRQGDTSKRLRKEQDDTRLGFEVDYDRVIFSAAFRSLQDKTQVIPLSKTDFVHTRLTHSLEVSVVGRSLGRLVGKKILEKYPYLQEIHGYQANDFGAIVAAAALAHDIGNPPFGHSGEKAIGEYFAIGNGLKFKEQLSEKEWQDLIDFEGNANGFSVLTSSRPGVEGGLRLTYATLGAFIKYPKESLPKKPTSNIADKKYGVFQQDKNFFKEVAEELGLIPNKLINDIGYERHPLAYLVEAADDICYTIIDFEDGINLGLVSEDYALEYLIKLVKDSIDTSKYNALTTKEDRISYLRALAIGSLINDVVNVFIENEEVILQGKFPHALTDKSKYKAQMNDIINLSIKNIYQSREVIEKEINGYQIINNLLDKFITAYNNKFEGNETNFDKLLLKILPEKHNIEKESLYERLLHICHFISMLTDGNALLYNKMISTKI